MRYQLICITKVKIRQFWTSIRRDIHQKHIENSLISKILILFTESFFFFIFCIFSFNFVSFRPNQLSHYHRIKFANSDKVSKQCHLFENGELQSAQNIIKKIENDAEKCMFLVFLNFSFVFDCKTYCTGRSKPQLN